MSTNRNLGIVGSNIYFKHFVNKNTIHKKYMPHKIMSENKYSTPKKSVESWRFCREMRSAFNQTSQISIYGNTDRQKKNFSTFLPGNRIERHLSANYLHSQHGFTCSGDLNICASRNISGNSNLAQKSLKLATKSVCRIPHMLTL